MPTPTSAGSSSLPPPSFPQGPSTSHDSPNAYTDSPKPLTKKHLQEHLLHHRLQQSPRFNPRISFGYPASNRSRRPSHNPSTVGGVPNPNFNDGYFPSQGDEELGLGPLPNADQQDKPPIPQVLPKGDDTPLPILPMIVLSIAMLGEFLTANVSTPFVLFMVEGFGVGDGDESKVGASTGVLVSTFFVTQFITSVLWATVADKHGRRAVLFISMLGSALTCCAFGAATNYPQAVVIRLLQGIFNGSLGVARGTVATITDVTNEGRAYAILGFCWGLGGVAGAVIGGAFESPAKKWPDSIGALPLFQNFPYLLPCAIASSFVLLGSVLSLFLGWDGGPREGLIRLPIEKDVEVEAAGERPASRTDAISAVGIEEEAHDAKSVTGKFVEQTKAVQKKISGYFARRVREAHNPLGNRSPLIGPSAPDSPAPAAGGLAIPGKNMRSMSRTTAGGGSAYGYGGRTSRIGSVGAASYRYGVRGASPGIRPGTSATSGTRMRRMTGGTEDHPFGEDLNFAQRLLLATEANVTDMSHLWVAAAINADNEDPFYDDEEDEQYPHTPEEQTQEQELEDESGSVFLDDEESIAGGPASSTGGRPSRSTSTKAVGFQEPSGAPRHPSFGSGHAGRLGGGLFGMTAMTMTPTRPPAQLGPAGTGASLHRPSMASMSHRTDPSAERQYLSPGKGPRRGSMASSTVYLPAIYANTGLASPPALAGLPLESYPLSPGEGGDESRDEETATVDEQGNPIGRHARMLSTVEERSRGSSISMGHDGGSVTPVHHLTVPITGVEGVAEGGSLPTVVGPEKLDGEKKPPSIWQMLPLSFIAQYGLLALHNTVHDQYFLSYLVSPYSTGGLGLNAAHFAQLIALMCGAQIFYQFYLYPNIGPPRGPWSHLAMFRIGCVLFIPSYLSVCLYRFLATPGDDGNLLVMTFLAISTAVRFCGTTFAYTAIAILLNYTSPPHLVSLSNSLAQSTVAFSRFLGPIAGGYLWSMSVHGNPSGYPYGFYVVSIVCVAGILHSFTIR